MKLLMCKFTFTFLVLFLVVAAAHAEFEGVLEMKTTLTDPAGAARAGGTQTLFISKAGTRMEMNLQMQQAAMKTVVLIKSDTPGMMYHINDASRTYSEMDLNKLNSMAAQPGSDSQYSVAKLGEEKILGYNTQHVLVSNKSRPEERFELWIAADFTDSGLLSSMQAQRGGRAGGGGGLAKALKDANVQGMALKTIVGGEAGTKVISEVVKAEKQSLPASTFQIPAGYTKSDGGLADAMGGLSGPQVDEARKKMQEAMKNMTPEQRQMMEKMLKRGTGE